MEREPKSSELLELGTASTDTLGPLVPTKSEGAGYFPIGLTTD
jgi:hypothetical protein